MLDPVKEFEWLISPYGGYCLNQWHRDEGHDWESDIFGVKCRWCDTIRQWHEIEEIAKRCESARSS